MNVNKLTSEKFNFFVPCEFQKGKEGDETSPVKVMGVASSATEDSDEETLMPEGFDYAPFLTKGILNYNHQSNKTSSAIVGEPTSAKVINNGKDFYIEGLVYPEGEGLEIIKKARTLKKHSPNRRFGFSIEGKVVERDPLNPKKVTKATITGCAITISPKNPNTLMDIVKGEYEHAFVDDNEDEKEGEEKKKAMDTVAIAPGTPESVEGAKPKNLVLVNKSVIFDQIIDRYSVKTFNKAKDIYIFVQSVNKKLFHMEGNEITQEAIQKSFDILDSIVKSESPDGSTADLGTGAAQTTNAPSEEDVQKATEAEALVLAKGFVAEGKTNDQCIEECIKKGYSLTISKSVTDTAFAEKEPGATIQEFKLDPGVIAKAVEPIALQQKQGFEAVTTLLKGFEAERLEANKTIAEFAKSHGELTARLEKLENEPNQRKTVSTVGQMQRFMKSEGAENADSYSLSNPAHRKALGDRLMGQFDLQKSKGIHNDILEKAIMDLEISKSIGGSLIPILQDLNILVTE